MKRKIILAIILGIVALWTTDVNAKVVSKDEIENNSYIIGNYYYTRKVNSANNYNGSLTTPEIMLAATTIDGGLDKMIIYHKDFLGNWINGLTGESITPPDSFEIVNRNLANILPKPNLTCEWLTEGTTKFASCESSIYDSKEDATYYNSGSDAENIVKYTSSNQSSNLPNGTYGVEYYILKDTNNNNPTENLSYNNGEFYVGNTKYTPTLLTQEAYDNTKFYNIVSRFYYYDGDEKIYSEYSNIENNGVYSKLGVTSSSYPRLKATIVDPSLNVEANNPMEPVYYNVKFNLENYDTTKYSVREINVHKSGEETSADYNIENGINSVSGSNNTYVELFYENAYKDQYVLPYRYGMEKDGMGDFVGGLWYLVAKASGKTSIPEVFNDISDKTLYSVRFDAENSQGQGHKYYVAHLKLCDKTNQYDCYIARTKVVQAVKTYTITFNVNSGDAWTSSTCGSGYTFSGTTCTKTVTPGSTFGSLPTPTRDGYSFDGWYTEATGGTKITSYSTVSITADQTLYAHWIIRTYTVTFNVSRGDSWTSSTCGSGYTLSGTTCTKTVTPGSTYGSLPTPTKQGGWAFKGWYDSGTDGTQVTSSSIVSKTSNHTLYARWAVAVCKPATVLHTQTCNNSGSRGCAATVGNGNTITYGTLVSGTPKAGDAYDCDVNLDNVYDGTTERFYYVKSDGNNSILIYYTNMNNQSSYEYDSSNENWHGPRTVYQYLPSTLTWRNPLLIAPGTRSIVTETGSSSTSGGTIETFTYTDKAARFLTVQEVNSACGITAGSFTIGELDGCRWLLENLAGYESGYESYGYWLETPRSSDNSNIWRVGASSRYVDIYPAYDSAGLSVRPVITVLTSDIAN